MFVDKPSSVEEVVTRRFDPCPAGQTTREEGVDVVPQVVDDEFCEFLGKTTRGGLNPLLLLKELRQKILLECDFQLREKGEFLQIVLLCASFVIMSSRMEKETRGFTSMLHPIRG